MREHLSKHLGAPLLAALLAGCGSTQTHPTVTVTPLLTASYAAATDASSQEPFELLANGVEVRLARAQLKIASITLADESLDAGVSQLTQQREVESGDDRGGEAEPGDDKGGHGSEPGDDHGGRTRSEHELSLADDWIDLLVPQELSLRTLALDSDRLVGVTLQLRALRLEGSVRDTQSPARFEPHEFKAKAKFGPTDLSTSPVAKELELNMGAGSTGEQKVKVSLRLGSTILEGIDWSTLGPDETELTQATWQSILAAIQATGVDVSLVP